MAASKILSLALLAAITIPTIATELPAGVIRVPLSRDIGLTAYYAEVQVGTPPQQTYLKVDTRSPYYSFLDPRNPVCASQNCKTFSTFNNSTSSYVLSRSISVNSRIDADCKICRTCHNKGPRFFNALSVLGNRDYLNNTIVLGSVTAEKIYFRYTSSYIKPDYVTGNISTILGKLYLLSYLRNNRSAEIHCR
jgi:hypothetical protein